MNCILQRCAHFRAGNCEKLGACGARHALEQAALPGGYCVIEHDNPTVAALLKGKLARRVSRSGRTITIQAVRASA